MKWSLLPHFLAISSKNIGSQTGQWVTFELLEGWESGPLSLTQYLNLPSKEKPACPSFGVSSGSWGAYSDGAQHFWYRDTQEKPITSITKFFEDTGEVWACRVANVNGDFVAWWPIVRHWYRVLHSTIDFLDRFEAKPGRYVEVGFAGLSGLTTPGQFQMNRIPYRKGEMILKHISRKWDEEQMHIFLLKAVNEIHSNLMIEPTDIVGLEKFISG